MIIASASFSADLYVFPGGTSPNYSTINDALLNASDGDKILVANGMYTNAFTIPANLSVSILPLIDGETYIVAGNVTMNANDGSNQTNSVVNIHGMVLQGDFNGTTSNASSSQFAQLNVVNCEFHSQFNPHEKILTNLYYSKFYNYVNGMIKEVIGNTFETNQSSTSNNPPDLKLIHISGNSSISSFYSSTDMKMKIYANKFINRGIKFYYINNNQSTSISEVHVANNFFKRELNFNGTIFCMRNDNSYNNCDHLIENNTVVFEEYPSNTGWFYYAQGDNSQTHIIRNNVIYQSSWSNSYAANYFTNGGICIFENNLINSLNYGPYSSTVSSSSSSYMFNGSFSGGSISVSNNHLNSDSYQSSNIDQSSGKYTALNNLGSDIMDCRDIDDTRNDVGTYGGPHSWNNYHEPYQTVGKGRILDLSIPSVIYGLPGVSPTVKSKAIRLN